MSNNSSNLQERKNYISISEFESFYEVQDSNPLIIVDIACNIVFSNQSFKRSFNTYQGQKFFDLESEPNLGYLLFALTGSNYNNFQFDVSFSPEYNLPVCDYNVVIERISVGEREYFVLIFKSLLEKERLEERINNLHNALEYGNVPVIITDEIGRITYSTNSFEKILNAQLENIYNSRLSEVLSFYLDQDEILLLEEAVKTLKVWTKTIVTKKQNDDLFYYELKLHPVYREGSNIEFILTANDISSHILKNQIIKKSENRQKSIINNISDLLLIIKRKDGIFYFENANDNFCRAFNIDKYKSFKQNIKSLVDKTLLDNLELSILNLEKGDSPNVEFKYNYFNIRHYNVKITFIDDKIEEEILYIVSLQDITDEMLYQKQLEKAYEKENHLNKLKTAFLENMSHEIRTPFNAIIGYSEIIDDCVTSGDYDTISDLASSLKDVLQRILNLFANIVEVFQIDSGEVELDYVLLNCNQVLKSVFNKRSEEAALKNLDFHLETSDEILSIETDWIKFERIIDALVDNAIKYTFSGDIVLRSEIVDGEVGITISDTGKGIDEKEISRMLEPFAQEEEGYERNYEGAGLGLTIAYKLTKLMGGKFVIQSARNKGTDITITFPIVKNELKYS